MGQWFPDFGQQLANLCSSTKPLANTATLLGAHCAASTPRPAGKKGTFASLWGAISRSQSSMYFSSMMSFLTGRDEKLIYEVLSAVEEISGGKWRLTDGKCLVPDVFQLQDLALHRACNFNALDDSLRTDGFSCPPTSGSTSAYTSGTWLPITT